MEEIKIFNNYVKQFDLTVKEIMYKYHHTLRVMDFCNEIAISLNLNKRDIYIANLCGLFHDIARFKQWTIYKTYNDKISYDHGDMGAEITKELIKNLKLSNEEKEYILNAVKYHNKKEIPFIDERNNLFMKLVRDADKLDIMNQFYINVSNVNIKDIIYEDIINNKVCDKNDVITDSDKVLRIISWVNDFNFNYSYNYLLNKDILSNKFKLLEICGPNEKLNKLKDYAFNKVRECIKC